MPSVSNLENAPHYSYHSSLCGSTIYYLSRIVPIRFLKHSLYNVIVDVGALEVTCQFLNGPATTATCTIQYGNDPTYVNLPYTDSSTGTNVNSVTVLLSTPLLASTLYYYVVSSTGARMQGMFRSGMSH